MSASEPSGAKPTIYAEQLRRSEIRFKGPNSDGRYFLGFYNRKGRMWGPIIWFPADYEVVPDEADDD